MMHLLKANTTSAQAEEMLERSESMSKIVMDIRRRVHSGGGEMHVNRESVLLDVGSERDEVEHSFEWTAADMDREIAAELVPMQTMIRLWERSREEASQSPEQRVWLSVQAKDWSDKAVDFSG